MNRTLPVVAGGIVLVLLLAWSSLVVAAPPVKATPVPHQAVTATPVPTAADDGQSDSGDVAPDLGIGAAAPTPATPGPMTSRIFVFNLDTANTANVAVSFFNLDGSLAGTISPFTIAPNGAVPKALPTTIKSGFMGSAVVSSDKKVQAFVTDSNGGNTARDEYNGSGGSGSTLTLPLVRHLSMGTQHSLIAAQNTSGTAGNVTLHLYNPDGTEVGAGTSTSVQPSASAYFNTDSIFPTGTFTGTGQLVADPGLTLAAAEQTEYYKDTASFTGLVGADADTTLYLPFVERRRNSSNAILSWDEIYVRNNGGGPTDITLSLISASGVTKMTVKRSAVPGSGQAQFLLNTAEFSGLTSGVTTYFSGWATITSSGQAISSYALDAQNSGLRLFGFSAIPLSQVGTKYACGDTFRISSPSQNSKLNLVNLGAAAASVTVKLFKPGTGAGAGSKTYSVGPKKLVIANLSDSAYSAAGSNFEGMAVVTSSSGNIVVTVNTQYASGGITSFNCIRLQ